MSGKLTCEGMKIHNLTAEGPAMFSGRFTAPNDFTVDTLKTTRRFCPPRMASGMFVVNGNRAG